ncbi:MAG TPA: TolC family protein [Puia sp.]|nr:TolC family protein [Puia sp.]
MKGRSTLIWVISFLIICKTAPGQDSLRNTPLKLTEAYQLALNNSFQLKLARTSTQLSKQETEIEKLGRLPNLSTSFVYGRLSDADVWNNHFSDHQKAGLPHPLMLFSVEATETLFAGGRINNAIRRSTLEEQIAFLRQEKDETDIKFLVTAQYLDIYRLLNQRNVYINNTMLAKQRLKNILSLRNQGMVTLNDQLRTELTISDYELTTRKIANGVVELNNQLNIVLGLPDSTRLLPDTTMLMQGLQEKTLEAFLDDAYKENHELKISAREKDIAETNIKILKGERLPEVALVAQSDLQRPFLNAIPAIDVYYNVWRAGVGIKYNISSIYQSPRKIKAGLIGLELSRQQDSLQRQNVEVAVKNAFIKYNESLDELRTYRRDLGSAEENYKTVEKRYFNQLALLTDLIDATNTKTEAEIKVTNAEINTLYTYYQMLKTIGTL